MSLAKAVLDAQTHRQPPDNDTNYFQVDNIPSGADTNSPVQQTPASPTRDDTLIVDNVDHDGSIEDGDRETPRFVRNESDFRGPLNVADKSSSSSRNYRGKRRNSSTNSDGDGIWKRWVEVPLGWSEAPGAKTPLRTASPVGDAPPERSYPESRRQSDDNGHSHHKKHSLNTPASPASWDATVRKLGLKKHRSLPHMNQTPEDHEIPPNSTDNHEETADPSAQPPSNSRQVSRRWGILKNKFGPQQNNHTAPASAAVNPNINISDELLSGGLATLMLRMHFERDEQDHRRVPVLLHHLKIRVSDSIHPLNGTHAVFRIECEYANGAARWVIYRELRDFVSLHTHYRVANVYNRGDLALPEFPLTSLPYFKYLKSQAPHIPAEERRASFARLQRMRLENYLLELIRAVMFRPESNRLCRFFEISALSVALAKKGGIQGKAGLLRVMGGETSRKGVSGTLALVGLGKAAAPRWWTVRESYLVAVDDPGDTKVWDVFLLDGDFTIERPKRYYRKLKAIQSHDSGDSSGEDAGRPAREANSSKHGRPEGELSGESPSSAGGGTFSRLSARLHLLPHKHEENKGKERAPSGDHSLGPHFDRNVDPSTGTDPRTAQISTGTRRGQSKDKGTETDLDRLDAQADEAIATSAQKKKSGKGFGKGPSMDVSQHTFYLTNSQRRLKLVAKNERQMHQWIASMERMAAKSHWHGTNRFDSFAPIRLNVAAQWLVDGRDYFWNLSRAISLAKDRIYIHDWWLSPELQMRRPGKPHYRLDNLLKRKAEEGVKIFVIIYKEVSNRTTPTDSNFTKQRLVGLHPNIMVQRSPSHFSTGTFYWAHHEKMCVIDEAVGFMGGLDLCFGRWDTPQHTIIDDADEISEQIWPGKDYSNPRISDFHTLNKPEQDMYDRSKVPRMPWHDVAMQMLGQPPRDLCRHFVQRWNYLLRVKTHSRIMPFLLPPPDFTPTQLRDQGLTGTCEIQICRSAGNWSMGLQNRVEHSIQNAYLKAIQMSEHFVYIENQFFITSTVVNDVRVENKIGDALVSRIIRAYHEGTPWRACIVIPLLPGFTFPIDHGDASAIRIILECQNRTISRGPNSIFSRLRKEGIDPNDYISFFSLRSWGKLRGEVLTTEQLYIHAKIMIVDDRLAIIGSANINERSQRGDRDSELASVIRDTDMVDSTMAGKPFRVGRFAHTLRIRLMREHLGVDVDAMYNEDLMTNQPVKETHDVQKWDPDKEERFETGETSKVKTSTVIGRAEVSVRDPLTQMIHGIDEDAAGDLQKLSRKMGVPLSASADDKALETERRMIGRDGKERSGFAGSVIPTLEEQTVADNPPRHFNAGAPEGKDGNPSEAEKPAEEVVKETRVHDGSRELFGAPADAAQSPQTDDQPPHPHSQEIDADAEEESAIPARKILRQHLTVETGVKSSTLPIPTPEIDPHGFDDPVSNAFYKDVWIATAAHNTEIFRKVFHCTPDDLVTTWKQYKEYVQHQERLNKHPKDAPPSQPPVGRVPSEGGTADDHAAANKGSTVPSGTPGDDPSPHASKSGELNGDNHESRLDDRERTRVARTSNVTAEDGLSTAGSTRRGRRDDRGDLPTNSGSTKRKQAHLSDPLEQWEKDEMEELLKEVRGHLVIYPTRFLEGEDISNNFLFNADRLLPMPIYN